MKDKNTKSIPHGFTLIELMVATSIFAMVMVMASGAFLSVIDANRKAQSQQNAFINIDYALEGMSRTIRVGQTFRCVTGTFSNVSIDQPQDCLTGGSAFAFEAPTGSRSDPNDQIVYRLNGTQIERSTLGGQSGTFIPITAPEIVVQGLTFYVRGALPEGSDPLHQQPLVLITVYGYVGSTTKSRINFNLQTTIVQRTIDI